MAIFYFMSQAEEVRGAEALPVDVLTLPLLSVQSSSLTAWFHFQASPGLQTKTHSTPFPQPQHGKHRETGDLGGFCCNGIQFNFLPVPQNCKHLNRPNLGLRICKETSEFCMTLFLSRTVCIGLFLA